MVSEPLPLAETFQIKNFMVQTSKKLMRATFHTMFAGVHEHLDSGNRQDTCL